MSHPYQQSFLLRRNVSFLFLRNNRLKWKLFFLVEDMNSSVQVLLYLYLCFRKAESCLCGKDLVASCIVAYGIVPLDLPFVFYTQDLAKVHSLRDGPIGFLLYPRLPGELLYCTWARIQYGDIYLPPLG